MKFVLFMSQLVPMRLGNIFLMDFIWCINNYINNAVVASVLLGAQFLAIFQLQTCYCDCLREGFCRKEQNNSSSSSDGCGSNVKCNSSVKVGHTKNIIKGSSHSMVQCSCASIWNSLVMYPLLLFKKG